MNDKELLEYAAKAASIPRNIWDYEYCRSLGHTVTHQNMWNPLNSKSDRFEMIEKLQMGIDFQECTVWKRFYNNDLLQEWWGGECGDEAHAVLRVAAEIGKRMT